MVLLCTSIGLGCQAAREADRAADDSRAANGKAERGSAAAAAPAARRAGDSTARQPEATTPAKPTPQPIVVPAGAELKLELVSSLSSATSHQGDLVVARLASPVKLGERVVLAEGTEVRGHVTAAVPSGRVKGRARLAVNFESVRVGGADVALAASGLDVTADSAKKRDAAIIGGGAGAGAIIGAIAKGGKGAAVGAAIGGAAGTGAVLATKGYEVELPAGTAIHSKLEQDLRLQGS